MKNVLQPAFYRQPALTVAEALIGKYLVRQTGETARALMITETEAYTGPEDKACHAARGRTPRTEVMFGPPGYWYVYLIYGMYEMLNIVTDEKEHPAAVLIRGTEEIRGPGRLTRDLTITRDLNGVKAARTNGLWIEDRGTVIKKADIKTTPRIGINYAEEWAEKPFRFILEDRK